MTQDVIAIRVFFKRVLGLHKTLRPIEGSKPSNHNYITLGFVEKGTECNLVAPKLEINIDVVLPFVL